MAMEDTEEEAMADTEGEDTEDMEGVDTEEDMEDTEEDMEEEVMEGEGMDMADRLYYSISHTHSILYKLTVPSIVTKFSIISKMHNISYTVHYMASYSLQFLY